MLKHLVFQTTVIIHSIQIKDQQVTTTITTTTIKDHNHIINVIQINNNVALVMVVYTVQMDMVHNNNNKVVQHVYQ